MTVKTCMGTIHNNWAWQPDEKDGVVAKKEKVMRKVMEARVGKPKLSGRTLEGQMVLFSDGTMTYMDLGLCKGDNALAMDSIGNLYKRKYHDTTKDFMYWVKVKQWQQF